jgi:predicted exporter
MRLDFDDSLSSIRSNRSQSSKVQADVTQRFGASLSYMMAISEARTTEEAAQLAQKVESRLQPFVADGTVGSYDSILTYLPPAGQQQEILRALGAGAEGAFDVGRIRATFLRALDRNGFRREPFADYVDRLQKFLAPTRPLTLADLEGKGLGRLVDRYVHRTPDGVKIVTYLYPTDPRWKRIPPPGLVEAISGGDEGIVVTGTNVVGRELRHVFLRDSRVSVVLGLFLVAALLWIDFRSVHLTGIALGQLVSGVLIMLGVMRLLDMHINYANAFVTTMIMGVGIDYSIHLVHRLHRNGGRADEGVLETGKGVVMAAATNVAGFGTLAFGSYPAMRSVGIVALIGSVTCLVTALTFVPAMMAVADPAGPDEGEPR